MCVHSVTDIVLETKCVHMYKIGKKFCVLNNCIGTIHCSSIQMFGNFKILFQIFYQRYRF